MTSGRFQLNEDSDDNTTNSTSSATSSVPPCPRSVNSDLIEHIRKFTFSTISTSSNNGVSVEQLKEGTTDILNNLEIKIPELLQGGYSFYTWPSASILAWFLWDRRQALTGKYILELGAGTALPGILAAKCGAHVTLSDNCILPKSLAHTKKSCLTNNLLPGQDIEVIGLSWGLLLSSVFLIKNLDFIIAADCFYDPTVFEDIIVTVSFLLERNPKAKFLFTYQERSTDWSIEALLKKWNLCAVQVNIDDIGKYSGIDVLEFAGGHTIHLLEITREQI
ncbi:methyltransferase-like protein 23 [Teleopsis dalmanni]|uniref:methyltransferase-like protein 23 n=1 Tax=Teleopsis dalmanni TaxID=139649 RepID=UPI000D329ED7|nr:methyltransferase-like protein 23 [Teleopsis dalmanni]